MGKALEVTWKPGNEGAVNLMAICDTPCAIIRKEASIPEQCDHLYIDWDDILQSHTWHCNKDRHN